ncbi:MAG: hypothetical protein U0768_05090 [Anaerolineae bacterium]
MLRKVFLWAIPVLVIALIAVFAVTSRSQAASGPLASLQQLFANGGAWFIVLVLLGLWLGILIGATRGVVLGIVVGLFTVSACRLALPVLPNEFTLFWLNPPVLMTLLGIGGGLIGGLFDRSRGTAAHWQDSLSVRLALAGNFLGFAIAFCTFTTLWPGNQ